MRSHRLRPVGMGWEVSHSIIQRDPSHPEMSLAIGTTVGPYQVLAPLGEGGMGEANRDSDNNLKRDVAIKILPDLFSADPDRLARLDREAQLLAALTHPNIAHIHGFEESSAGPGQTGL